MNQKKIQRSNKNHAVNKSIINGKVVYKNTINKKAINKSTEKKNAKKKKQINKLNKKLLKEQKEKQKELKRIEKLKIAIKYSFVFVLFIFAVILFLLSPVFYIKNIEVEGNSKISSEQIKALLQISSTTNIFEESNNKVNAKLKENKYIEKADVRRILPWNIY